MNKEKKGKVIFICLAAFAVFLLILSFFIPSNNSSFAFAGNSVAVVNINGVIQQENMTYNQTWLVDTISALIDDPFNKGLIIVIDSPGGGVYESDELYLLLREYSATGKPVVAYLKSLAASGGYYIACGADKIWANRNTLTGSIGVISGSSIDLTEFFKAHGIKMTTITAGKNKNMMNIDSPFSQEQREIMQGIADECYEQFTQIVAESRKLPINDVVKLADGRVYTAKQALNLSLIDEIGSLQNVKDEMCNILEDSEINFVEYEYIPPFNFSNFMGFNSLSSSYANSQEGNLLKSAEKYFSGLDGKPSYLCLGF